MKKLMKMPMCVCFCGIIQKIYPQQSTPDYSTMPSDKLHDLDEEDLVLIGVAIHLTTMNCPVAVRRPYNDLPLSGADYTYAILQGNPRRTIDVFQVTTSTFLFICNKLLTIQIEPVSKLLPFEEQVEIFLYIIGHNSSNQQAQDWFQHSGQTICKSVNFSMLHFCLVANNNDYIQGVPTHT
jgi:hypothetical protein